MSHETRVFEAQSTGESGLSRGMGLGRKGSALTQGKVGKEFLPLES